MIDDREICAFVTTGYRATVMGVPVLPVDCRCTLVIGHEGLHMVEVYPSAFWDRWAREASATRV